MRFLSVGLALLFVIGGAVLAIADTDAADAAADTSVSDPADDTITDAVENTPSDISVPSDEGDQFDESVDAAAGEDVVDSDADITDTVTASDVTINAENVMLASVAEDNVYPADAPLMGGLYIECSTTQLGDVLIYIPTEYQYKSFTKTTSGAPVNITADTITGYSYKDSSYYIRWSSFGQAQYRTVSTSGYGYTYNDLDITDIKNTNVVFIESLEDLPPVPDSDMTNIITIFLLGVIVLCLFMRRFSR